MTKKQLTHKEFGFYTELTDFVNKNNLRKVDIEQIVLVNGNVILFYWRVAK